MRHCDPQSLEDFFGGRPADNAFINAHLLLCRDCYGLAVEVVTHLGEIDLRMLSPTAIAFREIMLDDEARAREQVRARGLVSLLLALDSTSQKRFIRSDPRARNLEFISALAKAAGARAPSEPETASTLCTYGMFLLDNVSEIRGRQWSDLKTEFLIELANVRRIQADRDAANELLNRASREGSGNPALLARLGSVRASVRLDDGKPDEALMLLSEVRRIYENAGDNQNVGRTMVQIADITSVFDPVKAYRIARHSLLYLSAEDDLRVRACALGMMVECLIEQGRGTEALREYRQHLSFMEQFCEPALQVRVHAMEARLAAVLDQDEEAHQLFSDVIDECFERGLYQLMTSYQILLLCFYIDRRKWPKAVELCSFAAQQEELPEGVRTLWGNLRRLAQAKTLDAKGLREARELLKSEWKVAPGRL
jgi:tetratricopeptide (TPR) repeat protein